MVMWTWAWTFDEKVDLETEMDMDMDMDTGTDTDMTIQVHVRKSSGLRDRCSCYTKHMFCKRATKLNGNRLDLTHM
jgi:hypothetical protein